MNSDMTSQDLSVKRSNGDDENTRRVKQKQEELSQKAAQYVDSLEGHYIEETYDLKWLTKLASNIQTSYKTNYELRAKYSNEPMRFIESETALSDSLKQLSNMTENEQLYDHFESVVGDILMKLLAHPNPDIKFQVLTLIDNLIDEDEPSQTGKIADFLNKMQFDRLILAYCRNLTTIEMLDMLSLRERQEHLTLCLTILIELVGIDPFSQSLHDNFDLTFYIINQLTGFNSIDEITVVNQYCSEYLAKLLSEKTALVRLSSQLLRLHDVNLLEVFLLMLSKFKKQKPQVNTEQEEFVENIVDCICLMVNIEDFKRAFVDELEGLQLLFLVNSNGKWGTTTFFNIIKSLLSNESSYSANAFIELGGLKHLFKRVTDESSLILSGFLSIVAVLFRILPFDSASRFRLVNKLMDKSGKYLQVLVDHRIRLDSLIDPLEREEPFNGEILSDNYEMKISLGLDSVQQIDIILLWLFAEDESIKEETMKMLSKHNISIDKIHLTIKQYVIELQELLEIDESEGGKDDQYRLDAIEMLQGLISN